MRFIRVPVALLLSVSMPGLALAQVPPPPSGPAEPQPETQPEPDASIPTHDDLSEDEKIALAKEKYIAAEQAAADGDWEAAVPLYEEAYYLVPGKHGFAHKVGTAAWNMGDCNKAQTYLKHFLQYSDPERQGDKIDEAKQILGEISVSGCATEEPTPATTGGAGSTADPADTENPLDGSSRNQRADEAAKARQRKKDEKRGLLIGGAVLTSLGVAGLATGATGLGLAGSSANSLQDLSSNNTNTGFPRGDFACRGVTGPDCPFELENRLRTGNILGYVGFGVGGAALIGGVAMLAIWGANKKKRGGAQEQASAELTGVAPMFLPGGGGGAMAEIRF